MNATHKHDRFGRVILWSMWGFGLLLFLLIIIFGNPFLDALCVGLLVLGSVSVCVFLFMVMVPAVTLSTEGIVVRRMFRKRLYSWKDIKQAGIIWRMGRGLPYNQMVLVPSNGSPRHYQDKTFYIRNLFKAVFFQVTSESRAYVCAHYGPLDFDLSDGRGED